MKKFFVALLACLLSFPAYGQKNKTTVQGEITAQFPDNTSGLITPLNLRNVTTDILNASGGLTNVQTTSYNAVLSDCGNTISMGGVAFISVNIGPTANYVADCTIAVANVDPPPTGRGKKVTITGLTFPNLGILWPTQSFVVKNMNGTWAFISQPGRWKLTQNQTFFVDGVNGNDNNDGLAAGSGNAWQHPNLAFVFLNQILDANAQVVTLQAGCVGGPPQTYTETTNILDIVGSYGNGAKHLFQGDTGTVSNCIHTGLIQYVGPANAYWRVQGWTLNNSSGACLEAVTNVWLFWQTVNFNNCQTGAHALEYGAIQADGAYTISAGAANAIHISTTSHGYFVAQGPFTVTMSGTPNFSINFANMDKGSIQEWNSGVITFGTITAGVKQWNATTGGGINTGGGATVIPGTVAGTPAIGASSATSGWAN